MYLCLVCRNRRSSIGSVAISGAEKTVVFNINQEPPGTTYPIGASGGIISDIMDETGSLFLCCFLAKEKRMVCSLDVQSFL